MNILIYETSTGIIKSVVSGSKNIERCLSDLPDGFSYKETKLGSPVGWKIVDGEEVEDIPVSIQKTEVEKLRRLAYQQESDPLFFKWQRGEATQEEYLSKIQEIKERYPYET